MREVGELFGAGYREVTLLGQNVNSYRWERDGKTTDFAGLLEQVASVDPLLRVRFSTSHPKDLSDELLHAMARHPNICRAIHLPAQSGNSRILELMNRKYTREWYLGRIEAIRRILPDCAISTDLIAGFCTETEQEHRDTLSLMREVGYEFAFMFKYSERPNTKAARHMADDVPENVKTARLTQIIELQNELSLESNRRDVGRTFEVLVEGVSKRRDDQLFGRTSQNKVVVLDRGVHRAGEYVTVRITGCTSATLTGEALAVRDGRDARTLTLCDSGTAEERCRESSATPADSCRTGDETVSSGRNFPASISSHETEAARLVPHAPPSAQNGPPFFDRKE